MTHILLAFLAISLANNSYADLKMTDEELNIQIASLSESNQNAIETSILKLKKALSENELSKESLINCYFHISRLNYEISSISESLQYADKALELIGPNNNHVIASKLLVIKGYTMNVLLIDRADLVLQQAIDSAIKYENKIDEIDAYYLMADYYIQRSQFIAAHTYTAKAIELSEEIKEAASIADGHALNGNIYFEMEDYDKALVQTNTALAQYVELNNGYNVTSMKLLKASIYSARNDYLQAGNVYLEILAEPKTSIPIAFHCRTGLAKIKFKQGKFKEALGFISHSENMLSDIENTNTKVSWYLIKSSILIELGETERAWKLLNGIESSLFFPIDIMHNENVAEIYKIKYRLYEVNNQYKKALDNHKKFHKKDTANRKNKTDKVAKEIREKYFSDEKDEKLNLMTQQLEINQLKLGNKEQESFYQRLLIIFGFCLFLVFILALIKQLKIRRQLSRMLHTDTLTKVSNRYSLMKTGNKVFDECKEHNTNMSVILLDIDDFKSINDTHGHSVGDNILKKVASLGLSATRDKDSFGRLGGEEFVTILPNTSEKEALTVAERMRHAIYHYNWESFNLSKMVSVSIGVACIEKIEVDDHKLSFNSLLNLSDKAMYMAKETGKNKVTLYSSLHP